MGIWPRFQIQIINIYAWMLNVNMESNWFRRRFISYGETIFLCADVGHKRWREDEKKLFISFSFFFRLSRPIGPQLVPLSLSLM